MRYWLELVRMGWVAPRAPTVYDAVYHTSLGRFFILDIPMVWIVSVPKRSASETSHLELSEDVSVGTGTSLVVEQSPLENRPRGV